MQGPPTDTVHDQSFPYISVWFSRSVNEKGLSDWSIARVSIATQNVHHDLRFTGTQQANDILADQFTALVANYLPEGTSPIVLTANECVLEMPSAIMKGLRVTGQEVRNGVQRVLVTFRFFLGSMSAMFQPGKAPSVLSEVECALSTRTINDIILPALSLAVTEPCAAAKQHPETREQLKASWEKLSAAQAELTFYCDLISRFVRARDMPHSFQNRQTHVLAQSDETDPAIGL